MRVKRHAKKIAKLGLDEDEDQVFRTRQTCDVTMTARPIWTSSGCGSGTVTGSCWRWHQKSWSWEQTMTPSDIPSAAPAAGRSSWRRPGRAGRASAWRGSPEVELVEDERLLDDARRDVREVLLVVVDLECGEHRVVVADVDAGDPVADRVRFCASSGEVMVIFPVLSRLKMSTSFCFSMTPYMTERPAGSAATYCPGRRGGSRTCQGSRCGR